MRKRLFSILTALALCLSLLPTAALAEGTPSYSIDANSRLVISGTTDGSDLPTTGFTSIKITSTGVVTDGNYTVDVDNYGTITGGTFAEVLNRNGGTGSSLALITGGTFETVYNYGNMTGGTVETLRNIDTTNYGHTVQGVTVTGSLYNNNSNCNDMTLNITLDKVTNIFSLTTVRQSVDGEERLCPVGQKADWWLKTYVADANWYKVEDGVKTLLTDEDVFPCGKTEYVSDRVTMVVNGTERLCPVGYLADAWLKSNVENATSGWYRLSGEEWVKLTDTDVFPDTTTVYSKIPGMSLGTSGSMQDIDGNWIALVGDTLGVFNGSAVWYVGDQPVEGTNQGFRVAYTVQEQDLGKDAVAVLTDGYATIRSGTVRIVEPLSVTVPAAVAVGETITPVFNWQLRTNYSEGMNYQWQRDGVAIDGATLYTYTATESDVNHKLTLAISVKGTPYYTTGEVAVAANAVTITGVSAATELKYNGEEQTGYTGTPTSDSYTGDYDITYTGRNGTDYDSTTPPTNAGDYTVTFAVPASDTTYAGQTSLDFSIAKATIIIRAVDKTAYVGDTAPELTYTATGLVSGETLKTEPTLAYETGPDMTTAGTTAIKAGGAEAPEGGNYDITYVDGTLTVSARPSTGGDSGSTGGDSGSTGGGSYIPTYPPTVTQPDEGGSVTVSTKNPAQGSTVTITPEAEDGYEVGSVTVTDQNGNPVEITDNGDGTYTFTQPIGKVTVEVSFQEIAEPEPEPEPEPDIPCDGGADCPTHPFTDVNTSLWYHEAIDFVVENGIMNGVGDGKFDPNGNLSRAMLMTMLARLDGVDTDGGANWYEKGLNWAVETGVSDGTNPGGDISRQEVATMLYRYALLKGYDTTASADLSAFTDGDQTADWAQEAMEWAVTNGIFQGDDSRALNPQGSATRAEIAQIFMNFMESVK